MRIVAGVEYCGRCYRGWQRQQPGPTIQEYVEAALSSVADRPVQVVCAGRTDAGVHALQQVIHFDTDTPRPAGAWVFGGNVNLPGDISMLWAQPAADGFHARFSAIGRSYRYLILNRRTRPAVFRGLLTWECRPLDSVVMAAAARQLIGRHDFSSFRARDCQAKSPVREVRRLDVRYRDGLIVIDVEADGFLQHMVRNIAGVLMAVGLGKERPGWAAEVLDARDRNAAGVTAPPDGLYLTGVSYPVAFNVPAPEPATWPLPC
jgi:tRNA pseudouridine38-40 synthase